MTRKERNRIRATDGLTMVVIGSLLITMLKANERGKGGGVVGRREAGEAAKGRKKEF